jgi:ABC-type multidrug transport system fused ATPase/permease subunit
MGVKIVADMVGHGTVLAENYPKYIIPYTPISLAVIIAILLLPVLMKYAKKYALAVASAISLIVFFVSELLLESKVIITSTISTTLENWQMFMCYVPPESSQTRTWRAVDVLIGDYNPAFKIHFYIISLVLIFAILNCFYGFAQMIIRKNNSRLKALVIQSVSTALFLGLCILACFTAFFRDGEITVSTLSAVLMTLFFVVFGVTAGIYVGSFLLAKKKTLSVLLPSIMASFVTLVMYMGEMILLSGHLYRFGSGFLFDGLSGIVLAPIDILIIIAAGCINAAICHALRKPSPSA